MRPTPRPCYSEQLLTEISIHESLLEECRGRTPLNGQWHDVKYLVWTSASPGTFNLGGDLALFRELIRTRNETRLRFYAELCIRNMWRRVRHFGAPIQTIALVNGRALGGGFEGILPADVIIAEESATFGLPEAIFNLFPGMGAMSLLSRKLGSAAAGRMIRSGKTYSAINMEGLGVVDHVVPDGQGRSAVLRWIGRHGHRRQGQLNIRTAQDLIAPLLFEELQKVVDLWVISALRLSERDLRAMDALVRLQTQLSPNGDAPSIRIGAAAKLKSVAQTASLAK